MDVVIEPVLTSVPTLGDNYRGFAETARWSASYDGHPIGEVWRGEKDYGRSKPVVCWMKKPAALGFSFPDSAVISGYARTTRKAAVQQLVNWHMNRNILLKCDDWTLHCDTNRTDDLTYLAMHPELGARWIHASLNREEKPFRGAMGGVGWQISGQRGRRTVIVHDVPTLEDGIAHLLEHVGRKPDPEDVPHHQQIWGLAVERHYPAASPARAP